MNAPPVLDHVVIDVRDRMEEAADLYRRLGFQLTPQGRHSLGSINHLGIFADNYLELLGFETNTTAVRLDVLQYPIGLNGLVFNTEDSAGLYEAMKRNRVPVEEPIAFFRPVDLPGGKREDARFRVVRLAAETIPGVRTYFCHHFTRHLVWRDEWRRHVNGAVNIDRVLMVAKDPAAAATTFRQMFGPAAVRQTADQLTLAMANSRVDIVPPEATAGRPEDMPDPAGRDNYLAALTIRTAGLEQAIAALAGVPGVRKEKDRIVVVPAAAFNVRLEFVGAAATA